jgi:hypothetical protein
VTSTSENLPPQRVSRLNHKSAFPLRIYSKATSDTVSHLHFSSRSRGTPASAVSLESLNIQMGLAFVDVRIVSYMFLPQFLRGAVLIPLTCPPIPRRISSATGNDLSREDRDTIIAHALALGAVMVTRKADEFARVPGFKGANWETSQGYGFFWCCHAHERDQGRTESVAF